MLVQDGFVTPRGGNELGPDGTVRRQAGRDRGGTEPGPKVVADFAAFEAAHNPDRGAGPGPKLGNPSIDSDPYAFASYRGGFAVVDAGANDLLWLDARGRVSVLAVFPPQTVKLTQGAGAGDRVTAVVVAIKVQSVPSCVTVGPDGALYVGELTGRPFPRGKARDLARRPGREPAVYASGFTNISDLAFDGHDLLVLEIASKGLTDPNLAGALLRAVARGPSERGRREGLTAPTGLAVSRDRIYISDCGVCPAQGGGPHGRLDRDSALVVDRLSEGRVALRGDGDEPGHLVHLAPGQLAQDQLVPCERRRHCDDREVERDSQPVEARAAVLAEPLVTAESRGEGGRERMALAAVLPVELLPALQARREFRFRARVPSAAGPNAAEAAVASTATAEATRRRRREHQPQTIFGVSAKDVALGSAFVERDENRADRIEITIAYNE